jgi:hypothetical protein
MSCLSGAEAIRIWHFDPPSVFQIAAGSPNDYSALCTQTIRNIGRRLVTSSAAM